MKTSEIKLRDPFVLTNNGYYYMYGTRVPDKKGFNCYKSKDLENWEIIEEVFGVRDGFWGTKEFWAPEVYLYNGRFYMFATFNSEERSRGTQILVSDTPDGDFEVWSEVITPPSWDCLDGTLYIEDGIPYMIFCHEWIQVKDGEIWAVELTKDLKKAANEPFFLWRASEAKWLKAYGTPDSGNYVTDGPFLYRDKSGNLCALWSSFCETGYAIAKSCSSNGRLAGEWIHEDTAIFSDDGGHGMIFETFEGRRILSIHTDNKNKGNESVCFIEMDA